MNENKEKLKIGILLDTFIVPSWVYQIFELLTKSPFLTIDLIILNNETKNQTISKTTLAGKNEYLLYRFFRKFDSRFASSSPHVDTNSENLLEGIPILNVTPIRTKFSDKINERDIDEIQSHDLDVILRFGFRILRGDILTSSKFGIWSFHHGDDDANRGGPPGFWEVMQDQPITGCLLQILSEDLDGGKIIRKSFSATHPFSVILNNFHMYWKSPPILLQSLKLLYDNKNNFYSEISKYNNELNFYDNKLYTIPKNNEMLKLLPKYFLKLFKYKLNSKMYFDQWFLMFSIGDSIQKSFWRYKKIIPPKDRFWADPHIFYKDEKYFVFIEEYFFKLLTIFNKNLFLSNCPLKNVFKDVSLAPAIIKPYG